VAAITFACTVVVYQMWRARFDVPFDLHGDARFNLMTVRNLVEQGWFQHAPRLGAPFGLDLHDFPLGGDNLQFLVLRLFAVTGASAAALMNLYLVLTFVVVAVTAGFVLRWVGLSEPVAAVFAVAYTFLPYHFYRGEHHLFLSAYWCVPLAAFLALALIEERPLFNPRRRAVLTLATCAVIGSTDPYYTAYALLLVGVAGAAVGLRARNVRAGAPAAAVAVAMVAVLGLNLVPSIAYRQRHGHNAEVAVRVPIESEIYGLKLTTLVLPRPHHRLTGLGSLAERYAKESPIPSEGGQALGLLGSLGLAWLLVVAAAALVGSPVPVHRGRAHINMALLTVACLLVGTIGGGSMLVAYFVTPQFRSWARISVVIAFFAMVAAGLFIERWRAKPSLSTRTSWAVLSGILLVALLDQTSGADVPRYSANAKEYDSDASFVGAIERRLAPGAMVFQLPVVPFPGEMPGLVRMSDYDEFVGYLHSRRLRWSYGGMKGREADWQNALSGQPTGLLLARLAAVGFTGLTVDRFGYFDSAEALERDIARMAGPPTVSLNGRLAFFDLTAYGNAFGRDQPEAAVRELADTTLRPVRFGSGPGLRREQADGANDWIAASGSDGSLAVFNPGPAPRQVLLTATLQSGGRGTVTVTLPGGMPEPSPVRCERMAFQREFSAPPGTSEIHLRFDGAPLPPELGTLSSASNGHGSQFRLLRPSLREVTALTQAVSPAPTPAC
jgi:phosphoglycerol transferase